MRPHVTRAKIRAPSPVLAVVLLAILVMASAVLGWLGGLVAWLIVLGALAVFAFACVAAPDPGLSVRGTNPRPQGCDPRHISTPVLLVHGAQERLVPSSHATWLAQRCRTAELWLRPQPD